MSRNVPTSLPRCADEARAVKMEHYNFRRIANGKCTFECIQEEEIGTRVVRLLTGKSTVPVFLASTRPSMTHCIHTLDDVMLCVMEEVNRVGRRVIFRPPRRSYPCPRRSQEMRLGQISWRISLAAPSSLLCFTGGVNMVYTIAAQIDIGERIDLRHN